MRTSTPTKYLATRLIFPMLDYASIDESISRALGMYDDVGQRNLFARGGEPSASEHRSVEARPAVSPFICPLLAGSWSGIPYRKLVLTATATPDLPCPVPVSSLQITILARTGMQVSGQTEWP